jgi:putative two-component system response regulator
MVDLQSWIGDAEAEHAFSRRSLLSGAGSVSALERASIEEIRRHARRLAGFAAALGRHIRLAASELGVLRLGSLLHDVGKAAIPAAVLFKCGRLTAEEFAAVKFHPVIGDLLCARVPALAPVRPIVRYHHERLDGSGYPDGLVGDEIPLLAQIVGVVDVYDALVYSRPYKPPFDSDHAFSILKREADMGWRRGDLVDALFDVVEGGLATRMSAAAAV